MLNSAGRVALKTRKGRTATVRPVTNLLINSERTNSTATLRLQHLQALGIISDRANLIVTLVWNEAANA